MSRRIVRTAPVIPGAVPAEAINAFRDRLHRVDGHRIWQGPADEGTTPVLYVDNTRYPARRVAWVLHHGTAPVGLILVGCRTRLCVHGPHLTDDVSRQRERILYAALHGITLAGPCRAGLHDLAQYGGVRSNGTTECRACENARRLASTRHAQEGARAA
ncbi:hypothetical protein ACUXZZ_45180 (plasmid) [Streptomyces graminifolii]|uniref:hypothetical protein n=1 Tax=Streptomyces graminifolii TaxID=1266771 RepID=UPI0040598EE9